MKLAADSAAARAALDTPAATLRLVLLHGPDESGSAALVARFAKAMGETAERIDLDGAEVARDPALLADEAAAFSMFGDKRWIRVQPAGEEVLPAVNALLEAPQTGNPVLVIAGKLGKASKLKLRCEEAKDAMSIASYPAEGQKAEALAVTLAREQGLLLDSHLAQRLLALTSGERGLLTSEINKLALYLDADPRKPVPVHGEALDALSAEGGEAQLFKAAARILAGDMAELERELARQTQGGGSLTGLLRITIGRAVQMAQRLAGVAKDYSRGGPDDLAAAMRRWNPESIQRAINRLAEAERASRRRAAAGEVVIAAELLAVARQAARAR
jgi:DNA polymerase III subunit delta